MYALHTPAHSLRPGILGTSTDFNLDAQPLTPLNDPSGDGRETKDNKWLQKAAVWSIVFVRNL